MTLMVNRKPLASSIISIWISALAAVLVVAQLEASEDQTQYGSIAGYVRDSETGKPIGMANVYLENTLLGDATNSDGFFEIPRVKPGHYVLHVSVIGYAGRQESIEVRSGEKIVLDLRVKTSPIAIPPVVITASRREQDIADSPTSLTALGSREIEKRHAQTPHEILRFAPGVVTRESQVSIRGSAGFNRGAGSRLLFLVDGVPMLAADTGDIKWDLIPVEAIERIEVLRSAASSLYGSSGLGGVINLVTRKPSSRPTTNIRIIGGYYDDPYYPQWKWTSDWLTFASLDITHSRTVGPLGIVTSFGKRSNDGYKRNSDYHRENAYLRLNWERSPGYLLTSLTSWSCDIYGHSTQWKSQAEALDIDPSQWNDRVRSTKLAGYTRLRTILDQHNVVTGTAAYYWNDWRNRFHDTDDNAHALRIGGLAQFDRILNDRFEFTLGAEAWYTQTNSTIFGDHCVDEWSSFGEARNQLSRGVALTLGLRFDYHRKHGYQGESVVSPRLAVVYKVREDQSITAAIGHGFRAPTIAESFPNTTVGGFTLKPNPALSPETGTTYEIGWRGLALDRFAFDLGIFRNAYRGLVEPETDQTDGKLHFVNLEDATIWGGEVWFSTSLLRDMLLTSISYMYLSTRNELTREPLAYRSRHNLYASAELMLGSAMLGVDYLMRSRTERVKVYEDDERVPIHVVDLRAETDMGRAKFAFKVSNLLQYNYTEIERTLAPIRSFTFSLRMNL